jgi:hypothetical protein
VSIACGRSPPFGAAKVGKAVKLAKLVKAAKAAKLDVRAK